MLTFLRGVDWDGRQQHCLRLVFLWDGSMFAVVASFLDLGNNCKFIDQGLSLGILRVWSHVDSHTLMRPVFLSTTPFFLPKKPVFLQETSRDLRT